MKLAFSFKGSDQGGAPSSSGNFISGSIVKERRAPAPLAPPTYEHLSDLPEGVLLTASGPLALGERLRGHLAAIEIDKKTVFLLCDPDSHNRQDFASLHLKLGKEYKTIQVGLAKHSLLLWLYSGAGEAVYRDRDLNEEALSKTLFFNIMAAAAKQNASDVHIVIRDMDSGGTAAIIFRIDGVLRRYDKIPSKIAIEIIGIAYTKLAEERSRSDTAFNIRTMQSCTIAAKLNESEYRIRYQTIPANGGIDAVMRLLHSASADSSKSNEQNTKSLGELGYSVGQSEQIDLAARKTVGVIIVSGVTGSGKSTTLQTLMTLSKTRHQRKAYSIEDPVEYKIFGVTQISVQRRADEGGEGAFSAAMRVVLRADPDVVMVGEVRDAETCSLLKQMAQSGHQVMTTVHAASAFDIVQRLSSEELALPREVWGSRNFMSALIYQRLVPLMCPECKVPVLSERSNVPKQTLDLLSGKFGLDLTRIFTTDCEGCAKCEGRGTKGVTVVAEVVPYDNKIAKLLKQGLDSDAEDYWRGSRIAAFSDPDTIGKTAFEHGIYKVQTGEVDPITIENVFEPLQTYEVQPIRVAKAVIHAVPTEARK